MTPPTQTSTHPPTELVSHHPLTSSELADIRSLLGAAAGAAAAGKGYHHDHGHDGDTTTARARPLAGRQVMVPAVFSSSPKLILSSSKSMSRAFFEGVLQPTTHRIAAEEGTNTTTGAMNEIVLVNIGNTSNDKDSSLVEMTRAEALQYFDTKGNNANQVKKSSIPAILPASVATTSTSVTTKMHRTTATTQSKTTIHDATANIEYKTQHPLIEIRETCNNQGQIEHSEIVNMSNVMERLGERLQNDASFDKNIGEENDKQLGTMLAETLAGVGQDEIEDGNTAWGEDVDNTNHSADDQGGVFNASYPDTTKKVIDETKYQELRSRLEELERLEEAEEDERKTLKSTSIKKIARSSKTTTSLGNGWSRGFLNNTSTTNATKRTSHQSAKAKPKKEEEKYSTRVTFSSDKNMATEINPHIGSTPSSPNSAARVKFSSRDDTIATIDNSSGVGVGVGGQSSSTTIPQSPNSTKVTFTVSDDTILSASSSILRDEALPSAPTLLTSSSSNSSARVTFSDDDIITEIPRIGQSKVPPRPVSAPRPVYFNDRPSMTTTSFSTEDAPSLRSSSISNEGNNIFGGVVKERISIEGSGDSKEQTPSQDKSNGDGGKKLSRFAQQRLQRG
jgi:hypothetical protein